MNRTVPEITESADELKSLLRNASEGYQTQRLSMLYLLRTRQAKNRTQVAELLGVHRITVGQWLATYEAGGLEALLVRRYPPGRVPLLCEEDRNTLRAELEKPNGFSSYGQITQYISETFGVEMSYKAVYALVDDKWGAKLKVARKSHQKKMSWHLRRLFPILTRKLKRRFQRSGRISKACVCFVKMSRDSVFCRWPRDVSLCRVSNRWPR